MSNIYIYIYRNKYVKQNKCDTTTTTTTQTLWWERQFSIALHRIACCQFSSSYSAEAARRYVKWWHA